MEINRKTLDLKQVDAIDVVSLTLYLNAYIYKIRHKIQIIGDKL